MTGSAQASNVDARTVDRFDVEWAEQRFSRAEIWAVMARSGLKPVVSRDGNSC